MHLILIKHFRLLLKMAALGRFANLFGTRASFSRVKAIYYGVSSQFPRFCSSQTGTQIQASETQKSIPAKQNEESETTYDLSGIMEFFDDPKNWGQPTVKVGRGWRIEELRLKSNSDLHKLWYVLLKERNMLLTMEQNCKTEAELFPNPERLDKVEESMENLETVIRERNKAYYELETRETGEAPVADLQTPRGKLTNWEIKEYPVPKHQNKEWDLDKYVATRKEMAWFHARWREQQNKIKRMDRRKRVSVVKGLLKQFPDIDEDYVQELYPDIDLKSLKWRMS